MWLAIQLALLSAADANVAIAAEWINVRASPDASSPRIGAIERGARVAVLGAADGGEWVALEGGGFVAFRQLWTGDAGAPPRLPRAWHTVLPQPDGEALWVVVESSPPRVPDASVARARRSQVAAGGRISSTGR